MSPSLRALARRSLAFAAVAGGLVACSDSNPTSNPPQAATVTVDPDSSNLTTGDSATFAATVKDADGNVLSTATVAWTSSDTNAAPVSASGAVSAILPGTSTITATSGSASGTAAVTIQGSAPIPLHEGGLAGTVTFDNGDTPAGGHGGQIDNIPCATGPDAEHYHVHLTLIVDGVQVAIPLGIGIDSAFVVGDSLAIAGHCFYWLHSHDRTGIIHVEPTEAGHTFTLGQYFDIWGQALTSHNVAGHEGLVYAYVDGQRFFGDPRGIQFTAHEQITIEVNQRVAPPIYAFPADY